MAHRWPKGGIDEIYACVFIAVHITAHSDPVVSYALCYLYWFPKVKGGIN